MRKFNPKRLLKIPKSQLKNQGATSGEVNSFIKDKDDLLAIFPALPAGMNAPQKYFVPKGIYYIDGDIQLPVARFPAGSEIFFDDVTFVYQNQGSNYQFGLGVNVNWGLDASAINSSASQLLSVTANVGAGDTVFTMASTSAISVGQEFFITNSTKTIVNNSIPGSTTTYSVAQQWVTVVSKTSTTFTISKPIGFAGTSSEIKIAIQGDWNLLRNLTVKGKLTVDSTNSTISSSIYVGPSKNLVWDCVTEVKNYTTTAVKFVTPYKATINKIRGNRSYGSSVGYVVEVNAACETVVNDCSSTANSRQPVTPQGGAYYLTQNRSKTDSEFGAIESSHGGNEIGTRINDCEGKILNMGNVVWTKEDNTQIDTIVDGGVFERIDLPPPQYRDSVTIKNITGVKDVFFASHDAVNPTSRRLFPGLVFFENMIFGSNANSIHVPGVCFTSTPSANSSGNYASVSLTNCDLNSTQNVSTAAAIDFSRTTGCYIYAENCTFSSTTTSTSAPLIRLGDGEIDATFVNCDFNMNVANVGAFISSKSNAEGAVNFDNCRFNGDLIEDQTRFSLGGDVYNPFK